MPPEAKMGIDAPSPRRVRLPLSGVAWHGPSRAMARPLEMLLGPRWGQGPTFNILIFGSAL